MQKVLEFTNLFQINYFNISKSVGLFGEKMKLASSEDRGDMIRMLRDCVLCLTFVTLKRTKK